MTGTKPDRMATHAIGAWDCGCEVSIYDGFAYADCAGPTGVYAPRDPEKVATCRMRNDGALLDAAQIAYSFTTSLGGAT